MVDFFGLMGKKSFLRVLEFFLENPSAKVHAAGLEKKLGLSKNSVLESLSKLRGEGVLKREEYGRAVFYSLANSDALVKELKRFSKICWLKEFLKKSRVDGVEVYLYGSAARGEYDEKSDVDLLAVGDSEKRSKVLGGLKHEKVSVAFFTPLEYSALSRKDKPFYESLERSKVRLV